MNSFRKTARFTGILFLTAMAASLIGGDMLESVISAPDFISSVSNGENLVKTGVLLEMVNAVSVAGIAILLFPVLKTDNEQSAVGYVSFRILETISCVAAAFIPLSILSFGLKVEESGNAYASSFLVLGDFLLSARTEIAGIFIPLFYSLGAILLYSVLYRTRLLPRFISIWGLAGVLLILLSTFTGIIGGLQMAFVLPIILNEIFLGFWLIFRGFNQTDL